MEVHGTDTIGTIATDYGTIHGVITHGGTVIGAHLILIHTGIIHLTMDGIAGRVVIITIHIVVVLIMATQIMDMVDSMVTMATIMEIPTQIKVKFTQAEEEDLSHLLPLEEMLHLEDLQPMMALMVELKPRRQ